MGGLFFLCVMALFFRILGGSTKTDVIQLSVGSIKGSIVIVLFLRCHEGVSVGRGREG